MHATGFCNQPTSAHAGDGLELIGCAITGMCHCAPPDNKPTLEEIEACRPFLDRTFALLPDVRAIVALGRLAFYATVGLLGRNGFEYERSGSSRARPAFSHGAELTFVGPANRRRSDNRLLLLATYHPSQQNTFTGRLTVGMLEAVFVRARGWIEMPGQAVRARPN
jgi:uracil-DNA glycosylase family 4